MRDDPGRRRRCRGAILTLALCLVAAGGARAAESALPVPRFVSLRADDVNLRSGPGGRYPVQWVYHRKGLPVEIVAQFADWRRIRDWQGTEGWVQEHLLVGTRAVVINGAPRTLRAGAVASAAPVAVLEPGVIAHLLECSGPWCRIETQDIKGWLPRTEMWGVFPNEVVK